MKNYKDYTIIFCFVAQCLLQYFLRGEANAQAYWAGEPLNKLIRVRLLLLLLLLGWWLRGGGKDA